MSKIPNDRKYTEAHEWVQPEADGRLRVGITDHAQEQLGDMVYVELPELGNRYAAGQECAVVESVKSASDLYCPLAGQVVGLNEALRDAPETVNQDPYGDGWIFLLQPDDPAALDGLLDADAYGAVLEAQDA